MEHVEIQLAALRATVESGFRSVDQRLDVNQTSQKERHHENVERLIRIEDQSRITNGRVNILETDVKHLHRVTRGSLSTSQAIRYLTVAGSSIAGYWWLMHNLK